MDTADTDPNVILDSHDEESKETIFEFKSFSASDATEILTCIATIELQFQNEGVLGTPFILSTETALKGIVPKGSVQGKEVEVGVERLPHVVIIDKVQLFQEQPELLDPHLRDIVAPLMAIARTCIVAKQYGRTVLHVVFKIIYTLAKARGYKTIVKFFPHAVNDLEQTLACLQSQDQKDYETWETRYVLLLWMSIVILIPFDLASVDSSANEILVQSLISLCKKYLSDAGPTRDMAAVLLSKLFSRKDTIKHLQEYISWAIDTLNNCDSFLQTGIYASLAFIFKFVPREILLPYATFLSTIILAPSNAVFIRKLSVKLVQRIGMTYLKPTVASWRYQMTNRSLHDTLKGVSKQHIDIFCDDQQVIQEVEEIIAYLLSSLKDKETNVRWSAAKGLGRITMRLPAELADEVLLTIIDLFQPSETDSAWHGGCLALAELVRRGLLLPVRLDKVIPIVKKALLFEVNKGSHGIGAHVRDAACYVCWAFARAYRPEVMLPYAQELSNALIVVSLFDRDINCRRAGAAAYQENVGRQGNFPHGIAINTIADYFSIGNRQNAYTKVACEIAKFVEYRHNIIEHVVTSKLFHWDKVVRELAAKTLFHLTEIEPSILIESVLPSLIPQCLSPTLDQRHGASIGVSEILLKSAALKITIPIESQKLIRDLIPKIEKARLFTGKGGVFMRVGVCRIMHAMSVCGFELTDKIILRLQDSLDENIKHANEEVQAAAVDAFAAFAACYYKSESSNMLARVEKYIGLLRTEKIFSVTRGVASALGELPISLLISTLPKVIEGLVNATVIQEKPDDRDAETRRNALLALGRICATVALTVTDFNVGIEVPLFEHIGMTCIRCFGDYSTDNRGDVGSWVREAAMQVLEKLLPLWVTCSKQIGENSRVVGTLKAEFVESVFVLLAKQMVEKINRVRSIAGTIFSTLLHMSSPAIPFIPEFDSIQSLIRNREQIDWSAPTVTFPILIKFLDFPVYRSRVLEGLIVSVGGLTESLVLQAGASLLNYFRSCSSHIILADEFIAIGESFKNDNRIIVPLLKTLDFLFASGAWGNFFEATFVEKSNSFLARLFALVKVEMQSTDVAKLIAGLKVYLGIVSFVSPIREQVIIEILLLLEHRFPMVRKVTATQFYNTLIISDDLLEEKISEEVLDVLTVTRWFVS